MGEKLGATKFDFDFEPFDTGVYVMKVKESDTVPVKEREDGDGPARKGPKNDFNYVIQFVAEGGEMDGRIHFERFQHMSQGHVGLKKLEACLIKMEAIGPSKDPAGRDTDDFNTDKFKQIFKMTTPGRKLVVIIKRTTSKQGGEFSNIVAFYHVNEIKQAQEDFAKKFRKAGATAAGVAHQPDAPLPGAQTMEPPPPTTAKDTW